MSRVTDLYKWLATKDEETQKRVTDLLSEVMRLGDERNKANASLASAESALITLNTAYSDAMRRCDELTANLKTQGDSLIELCDESNRQRAIIAGLEAQLASVTAARDKFVARFNAREVRCFGCGGQGWNTITTGDGSHGTLEQERCEPCDGKGYVTVRMSGYPRTLCEKCKGDEVSGCICGMVAP